MPGEPPTPEGSPLLSVLRDHRYRRLFAAQVIALLGTGLLTVALGLLAYDLAGDHAGAVLGTALAIKMTAYVAAAPLVTALTARLRPKTILVTADVVRATVALALPFVDSPWQIYLLIFVLQAASGTFTPTFQSVIPSILDDEDEYTKGLALSRLAYDLEAVVSPLIAAAALAVVSYDSLFLGTVLGFVVSAVLVAGTALPGPGVPDGTDSFGARATAGVRLMVSRTELRGLLRLNLVVAAATALVLVNTVGYVHDLGSGSVAVAVLLAAYGCGSMAVALAITRMVRARGDRRTMLTGAGTVCVALILFAVVLTAPTPDALTWTALIILWPVLGAGTSLILTPSARLLRTASTPETRTSVFAAQFALSHACFLITYPIAGWVGATAGQAVSAITIAALATLAGIMAAAHWPAPAPAPEPSHPAAATG